MVFSKSIQPALTSVGDAKLTKGKAKYIIVIFIARLTLMLSSNDVYRNKIIPIINVPKQ